MKFNIYIYQYMISIDIYIYIYMFNLFILSEVKAGLVKRCSDDGGSGQQAMMLRMSFTGMRRSTRPSDAQGSGNGTDGGFTSRLEVPGVKKRSTFRWMKLEKHPKNIPKTSQKTVRIVGSKLKTAGIKASDCGEKPHRQVLQFFQALRSHLSR